MIEVCLHGISLAHKEQCSRCWMWENSDAGKLAVARQRIAELEANLKATREHALPLQPTPYTGAATGVDLVDRLRGIYTTPVGERRFDASTINLEAADRIAELEAIVAAKP
jgi:hypothetical protein